MDGRCRGGCGIRHVVVVCCRGVVVEGGVVLRCLVLFVVCAGFVDVEGRRCGGGVRDVVVGRSGFVGVGVPLAPESWESLVESSSWESLLPESAESLLLLDVEVVVVAAEGVCAVVVVGCVLESVLAESVLVESSLVSESSSGACVGGGGGWFGDVVVVVVVCHTVVVVAVVVVEVVGCWLVDGDGLVGGGGCGSGLRGAVLVPKF